MQNDIKKLTGLALALAIVIAIPAVANPFFRPEKVQRTINTGEYQLAIQKNYQLDLRRADGSPIVDNGFPAVQFEDGAQRPLRLNYRESNRVTIRNALGQGNGLLFRGRDMEYLVATYPTQPFITIDLTFINHTTNPVRVARLSPLGIGEDGVVQLGTGETRILQPPTVEDPMARIVAATEGSNGHFGAWNPATGRILVAGFITHQQAPGIVRLARTGESSSGDFDRFIAECIFDSPVIVEPGERLAAETLYMGIAEHNPQEALERLVWASGQLESYPRVPEYAHHGWQPAPDSSESPVKLLDDPADANASLHRYGWRHVHLDLTAEGEHGLPGTPYPGGLGDLTRAARDREMTAGLTLPAPGADTAPLLAFLRQCRDWGVATVELAPEGPPWGADGEAAHPRTILEAMEAAKLDRPAVVYTKPEAAGGKTLADWALASRQYYLPPAGNPLLAGWARAFPRDSAGFTDHAFITAWTLAALHGAHLRPATPFPELSPVRRHVLSRLLPAPAGTARPLDLFQDGPPRRWVLPLQTPAGDWTIVALFNWEADTAARIETPLTNLGLNNDNYYTVYDFWASRYLGLIEKHLRAEVPANGVRLFGLRRYEKRPMLVASNRHYTQGAGSHTALDWSYDEQVLSGTFDGIADTAYTLTVLIPESYALKDVVSTPAATGQQQDGSTLTFTIQTTQSGPVEWRVECTYQGG